MHQGEIYKNSAGRFTLDDGYYWTCGDYMELLIEGNWISGRVEYGYHDDYYFITADDSVKINLYPGMTARA